MSNGFNVSSITFDANGEILGLADDVLASISAGAIDMDTKLSLADTINKSACNGTRCNG